MAEMSLGRDNFWLLFFPLILALCIPMLQQFGGTMFTRIKPSVQLVFFCVAISLFAFCVVTGWAFLANSSAERIDIRVMTGIAIGVGLISYPVLYKYRDKIYPHTEQTIKPPQKEIFLLSESSFAEMLQDGKHDTLRDSLISAKTRAIRILEYNADEHISEGTEARKTIRDAYYIWWWGDVQKNLKKVRLTHPEFASSINNLIISLQEGRSHIWSIRNKKTFGVSKTKIDQIAQDIIQQINTLMEDIEGKAEIKRQKQDPIVTCDKCGFIGVRNIKTRELEEMEDNQRKTGQLVLTRINSLGDAEPRHEKIPECIMQVQDFSINPPLSSHALPLFYMQFPRQCQHFKEWQKGLTPKEHLESLSKINRIEQPIDTASQMYDSDMGKHISRIKNVLEMWEQQLLELIRQGKLVELRTKIEMGDKNDFCYFLMHCPSLDKKYEDLGAQREIYKAHLYPFIEIEGKAVKSIASKEDIDRQRKYLNDKMQALVEAIEYSLSSYEHTRYKCPLCPHNMTKS